MYKTKSIQNKKTSCFLSNNDSSYLLVYCLGSMKIWLCIWVNVLGRSKEIFLISEKCQQCQVLNCKEILSALKQCLMDHCDGSWSNLGHLAVMLSIGTIYSAFVWRKILDLQIKIPGEKVLCCLLRNTCQGLSPHHSNFKFLILLAKFN